MSWTKRQLIQQAYEEIGMADYVFDLEPEQLQSASRRMDAMVATWVASGVRISYPMSSTPGTTDIDENTQVPDWCNEALYLNLAIRLGASMGKSLSPDTRANAKAAYLAMIDMVVETPESVQMTGNTPRGQGRKPWRTYNNPFYAPRTNPLETGADGDLIL